MRRIATALAAAVLVVVPATVAWAHPSFNPSELPVGQPVEAIFVVPHGCTVSDEVMPEDQDDAVPTTRVDLEKVDGLTIEPGSVEGWEVADDGEAIVWTAVDDATTEPIELPVTLTAPGGAAGEQLELSAYQECEDGQSYRWTSGSDSTPPVRLELVEGAAAASPDAQDTPVNSPTNARSPTATEPPPTTGAEVTDTPTTEATAVAGAEDDGSGALVGILVVLAVLAGLVSWGLARRSRGRTEGGQ